MKPVCQSQGCDSAPPKQGVDGTRPLSPLLDRVLESTTDGIIISNQNGDIILINSSVRKILGVSIPSLRSRTGASGSSETSSQSNKPDPRFLQENGGLVSNIHLTEIVFSRADEDIADIIRRAHERLDVICEAQGSTPTYSELSCQTCLRATHRQASQPKAGEERVIISISFPLKNAAGEMICVVTVLRNVDEVRQLNRLKSEAFLKISHELRTPLTVIKGSVDNLLQGVGGKLTQKQRSYLSQTRESAEKLIEQIEKLLTVENVDFRIFGR